MKKVLSIVLALTMLLGAIACTTPEPAATTPTDAPKTEPVVTEAPKAAEPEPVAEPEPEPAQEAQYVALGLTIKNKSGKTVDELYIYPTGGDKGVSVVAKGWPTKKADGEKYEQNIYIVRPADADMTALAVFEDGSTTSLDLGKIEMYGEVKLEETGFEYEVEDDPADQAAIALVVATGKTADNVYPGYVKVAAEMKNKTGKNIVELYLYEEGGDPKAYNNLIDYLYNAAGEKFVSWTPGKAKEGGRYVFSFFLRPETQNYYIDLVYDDGTSLEGALIDDWWKPNGDGNLKNEISMKDAADDTAWKIEYDDGTDDDYGMLMDERLAYEMEVVGVPADGWYPTYPGVPEVDPAEAEAALVELVKAAVPFAGEAAAEPEPEPVAVVPAGEVPAGYTGLHLMLKNKSGKEIYKVYLFPTGEDKGKNIFKTVLEGNIPTEDETVEGKPHEVFAYVFRETEKLGAMTLRVRYADETEQDFELKPLEDYTVFTVKADEFKQKVSDDAEDRAAMDAVAAAGVSTDGVEFAPIAGEEPAAEAAAVPAGYTGLHLMLKNKSGKEIYKVYLFPNGEDKGKNIFKTVLEGNIPTEDETVEGKPHEVFAYVFRETEKLGAMTLRVRYADETEQDFELKPLEDYTVFTVKADEFKQKVSDDAEDRAAMDAVAAAGVSTDGVEFAPIG